ncbi:ArsR/SmtB family transcription factor [Dictyobacter vulcani]|uniref:ArsR/SmtB family transcription factor n=1 Tax=Dictyobacter vulcani TaxID=2607529 RepID=UPI001250C1C8|nr:winged helix-turn-helix domain-containing protein [Dictyobacter vulcani]
MDEVYELQNLEQLRAISDALRVSILRILRDRPMTTKQLGDHLEMAPAKVHYHVRELEKVGLVQLVETREKGGILEKYYQPIAHSFRVPPEILLATPPDDLLAALGGCWMMSRMASCVACARRLSRRMSGPMFCWLRSRSMRPMKNRRSSISRSLPYLRPMNNAAIK